MVGRAAAAASVVAAVAVASAAGVAAHRSANSASSWTSNSCLHCANCQMADLFDIPRPAMSAADEPYAEVGDTEAAPANVWRDVEEYHAFDSVKAYAEVKVVGAAAAVAVDESPAVN